MLPSFYQSSVYLNGLRSGASLTLPETIEENLTLNGLTSAMSLTLPTEDPEDDLESPFLN